MTSQHFDEARSRPGGWPTAPPAQPAESDESFAAMIDALRRFQDIANGCRPPAEVSDTVARALSAATDELARYAAPESEQLGSYLHDWPGRGQALAPTVHIDDVADGRVSGTARFGRFYLGGNGAVHGGAIPLIFDEVLGRLAGSGGRPRSRTAYLRTDYRAITPIDRDLQVVAWIDREEGRKIFTRGELRYEGHVVAEGDALFVTLLPGQP